MPNSEHPLDATPVPASAESAPTYSVTPTNFAKATSSATAGETAEPTPELHVHNMNTHEDVLHTTDDMNATGSQKGQMKQKPLIFIVLAILVLGAGIWTGKGLNDLRAQTSNEPGMYKGQKIQQVPTSNIQNGQIFGNPSEKDFPDPTEGFLEVGGINGEGTHHLLRKGGPTQTVYLTSSITDLSKFEGMQVKIWGETNTSKAGWFMDVGRLQVIDTKGTPPADAKPASPSPTPKASPKAATKKVTPDAAGDE
jgi:hypothetical protein